MSIQEKFPILEESFWARPYGRDKDQTAMWWVFHLNMSIGRCDRASNTYARGSWGYTVLRTTYSAESEALWSTAMDKLQRWVTQYFIHENRLIHGNTDTSVNDELGRRFILEVIEDRESGKLDFPDLTKATQNDIKSLTASFEDQARMTIGDIKFDPSDNPRFCDYLIIDDDSLRSLAELPDETPPIGPVSRPERRARKDIYETAYVWLVDSQAVKRFQGVEDGSNYKGWMKIHACDLAYAWFERLARFDTEEHIFDRRENPQGSGDMWYRSR